MTRIALLAAVLSARLLARRAPQHRPIARALSLLLAIDVARLATAGATEGLAFRVDVALTAGWYVAMAGAVVAVLLPRSRAAIMAIGAWSGCVVGVLREASPGADLSEVWRAVYVATLAWQLFAVAVYLARAARNRKAPGAPETVALILAFGSLADLAGPWCRAHPVGSAAWEIGRWQSCATWAIVSAVQLTRWARLRP